MLFGHTSSQIENGLIGFWLKTKNDWGKQQRLQASRGAFLWRDVTRKSHSARVTGKAWLIRPSGNFLMVYLGERIDISSHKAELDVFERLVAGGVYVVRRPR